MSTISFHTDTTTSISHNNRLNIYGNKDINKEKTKDNIYYIQRDIKEIYKNEFDRVVEEYNLKQKREDRKIKDYYKKVLHDKKTEHQREIIIAVGDKAENTSDEIIKTKKEILNEYFKGFEERNPNLKVYNAVLHLDEGNPHLHINYVPVAHYNKGLTKRVVHNKALEEQGLTFDKWREKETGLIERLMNERGIKRHFEDSHKHMSVKEYKELKRKIDNLNMIKENLDKTIDTSKVELRRIQVYSKCLGGDFSNIYVETNISTSKDVEEGSIYRFNIYDEMMDAVFHISKYKKEWHRLGVSVFYDLNNRLDLANFKFDLGYGDNDNFSFKNEFLKEINPLMKNSVQKINDLSKNISNKNKSYGMEI